MTMTLSTYNNKTTSQPAPCTTSNGHAELNVARPMNVFFQYSPLAKNKYNIVRHVCQNVSSPPNLITQSMIRRLKPKENEEEEEEKSKRGQL